MHQSEYLYKCQTKGQNFKIAMERFSRRVLRSLSLKVARSKNMGFGVCAVVAFNLTACVSGQISEKAESCHIPLIVGHRGASGHAPEHTLRAYELAIEMGADYVEPDLVMTRDGVLVARHENEISGTTNVATLYPKRKKTKIIDGEKITGWFSEDFTLSEIKKLRALERLPYRSQVENNLYEVPTFEEILAFLGEQEKKRGRKIGLAPEIKHSTYFNQAGLPMEDKVVAILKKHGRADRSSKVMIQSFEVGHLKRLRHMIDVELVQLLEDPEKRPYDFVVANVSKTYQDMARPEGLEEIRTYADWVSPHKDYIVEIGQHGEILRVTDFVRHAHAAGLKVMPYTFRSDVQNLSKAYQGEPSREYNLFFSQKIDALFSDFPDHAVAAKKNYFSNCGGD